MITSSLKHVALFFATTVFFTTAVNAQSRTPADADPTRLADAPADAEPQDDWQIRIGTGIFYSPAFLGSDHYRLQGGPYVEVRYKDRFFLSVRDGAGFDLVKTDTFRAGPVVKFRPQRRENGNGGIFTIAGGGTDALLGLGDVPSTAEAGGYLEYQSGKFSAKIEVRKGIGGHDGLIADLGARYTTELAGMQFGERPIIFSIRPRASIVDDTYNQAYFGVNATQSAASGLAQFNAGAGLLTYGVGAAVVVPVSGNLSAALLGGYDRLGGAAADSSLVRERGSRTPATVGLGLICRFGL